MASSGATASTKVSITEQRARDLARAVRIVEREQTRGIYGVVAFHMQAGRIVRAEIKQTEDFKDFKG